MALATLAAVAITGSTASADDTRLYRVTVTNTTSGQPLSPPVIATHSRNVNIYALGAAASAGVRLIAENGDNSVLGADLNGAPGIYRTIATSLPVRRTGGDGPPGSGSALTVMIEARPHDVLSVVTMLGCTNDGFAAVGSIALPEGFTPLGVYGNGYDAGSEQNNELSTQLADGCGTILGPTACRRMATAAWRQAASSRCIRV